MLYLLSFSGDSFCILGSPYPEMGRPHCFRGDMEEEWRPVSGHEGNYEISSIGRIKSLGRYVKNSPNNSSKRFIHERIMRTIINKYGYQCVVLKKNNRNYCLTIHRIVATAFIGPRPIGLQVNHRDSNRANPRLENLEYLTPKENVRHSIDKGNFHGGPKKPVIRLNDMARFNSVTEAAKEIGVWAGSISSMIAGRVKTCKGFRFAYAKK